MQQPLWKIPDDWFVHWFNTPAYHQLYGARDEAEADAFMDRLAARVAPEGLSAPWFECACGAGRHAMRLVELGLDVVGMDLAAHSIEQAKRRAAERGLASERLHFFTGDMRVASDVSKHGPYGAATLLFTSFGYFFSDADHEKILKNLHANLVSGGAFVLDFLNVARVKQGLVAHEVVERSGRSFAIWRRIHLGWIEKAIHYTNEKGEAVWHHERVRAFEPHELRGMLEAVGFVVADTAGDYDLSPVSEGSPRHILICTKP